jgi:hypothetical protein
MATGGVFFEEDTRDDPLPLWIFTKSYLGSSIWDNVIRLEQDMSVLQRCHTKPTRAQRGKAVQLEVRKAVLLDQPRDNKDDVGNVWRYAAIHEDGIVHHCVLIPRYWRI